MFTPEHAAEHAHGLLHYHLETQHNIELGDPGGVVDAFSIQAAQDQKFRGLEKLAVAALTV